jgi:lipopolysaccharide/colanic/teichoic acid biosynthesis glycosyltransferase
MVKGADEEHGMKQSCGDEDIRYTSVGKFLRSTAMDELPQLINILRGDMSFVGPRALRPVEEDFGDGVKKSIFEIEGFRERSCVIPGLTGIGQIYLPHWVNRKERFRYDIWYCENQSFKLDLYIILISFLITFARKWEVGSRRFKFLEENLPCL